MILMKFNGRHDNLGDRLIFSCLYNELKQYDEVYFFGTEQSEFIESPLRFRQAYFKAIMSFFRGSKTIVFHPPGARFLPRKVVAKSKAERLKDRIMLLAWSLVRVELHITGISLGQKFDSQHYRRFKSIGVRDRESQHWLSQAGVQSNLCPDMAFLRLPRAPNRDGRQVMVSLRRETPDDFYDSAYSALLKKGLSAVLDAFAGREEKATFFSNVNEDREFNIELVAELTASEMALVYLEDCPQDLDYSRFFKNTGVVISNRLHVLLPAMSEGLLPIALVSRKHYKIVNLFCSFGLDEFLIYVEECESIKEKVIKLLDNQNQLRNENYEKLCELKKQAETYISLLVNPKR